MNAYLDHLLDLVEPDGSFTRESRGIVTETGFPDVERAAMLAIALELHAIRELLERLPAA